MKEKFYLIVFSFLISSCTTGQLHYTDKQGNKKLACDVEFVGMPSVDKYAVEYALSLCAKKAVAKGYSIEDLSLLDIDTSIPDASCGTVWDHELAEENFDQGKLSKKQYGYIIAHIDLGLAELKHCF